MTITVLWCDLRCDLTVINRTESNAWLRKSSILLSIYSFFFSFFAVQLDKGKFKFFLFVAAT